MSSKGRYILISTVTLGVAGTLFWGVKQYFGPVVYPGHTQGVHAIAFSPDGALVASGGGDGVRVWQADTGHEVFRTRVWPPVNHSPSITFRGPTELLFTDSSRGVVLVETETWTETAILGAGALSIVASASPDGRWVAAYFEKYPRGPDGLRDTDNLQSCEFVAYDLNNGNREHVLPLGDMSNIVCLTFHPTLPEVAAIDARGFLRAWNTSGEVTLNVDSGHRGDRGYKPLSACAFLPSGIHLCTPSAVFEYPSGIRVHSRWMNADGPTARAVAISGDGKLIAHGMRLPNGDGVVEIRDFESGEIVSEFVAVPDGQVFALEFSPDGTKISAGGLPRTGWGRPLFPLPDYSVRVVTIR